MYKNSEGYSSPTEGAAISNIMREYRKEQKRRYADKNRKKVYVASRYAGDVKNNTRAAAKYCRLVFVMRCGFSVPCPLAWSRRSERRISFTSL